jgi:hypothetical protein
MPLAIYREASQMAPGYVKQTDDGELAAFRTLFGTRGMIQQGSRARRCVAICAERFDREFNATPATAGSCSRSGGSTPSAAWPQ